MRRLVLATLLAAILLLALLSATPAFADHNGCRHPIRVPGTYQPQVCMPPIS